MGPSNLLRPRLLPFKSAGVDVPAYSPVVFQGIAKAQGRNNEDFVYDCFGLGGGGGTIEQNNATDRIGITYGGITKAGKIGQFVLSPTEPVMAAVDVEAEGQTSWSPGDVFVAKSGSEKLKILDGGTPVDPEDDGSVAEPGDYQQIWAVFVGIQHIKNGVGVVQLIRNPWWQCLLIETSLKNQTNVAYRAETMTTAANLQFTSSTKHLTFYNPYGRVLAENYVTVGLRGGVFVPITAEC